MSYQPDTLAAARISARLDEAGQRRRGHELARARRYTRRAERAAEQASIAFARAL
ncbi:hypothetical protein I601_0059 [Nocardioides dokdonensis FR1436]|uniref:Uncharacterized protein n=1 Tax=Nocardioides dokdonensis FR1436 TaxID=1300347 RepID=A0A1A9GE59_9ACTN|nr:hypothetical protein [Nocardioides dokdonensis]ANH36514.1 hypothetical protein I601_0059 [Nocardioides dokdonensis FR1436]